MKKYVDLIKNIGKIKRVKRSGWVREGIDNPESVADHSFRTAMMAMIFGPQLSVDSDKLIKMALVHDIGEGYITDMVVERGINIDSLLRVKKDKLEIRATNKILKDTNNKDYFINLLKESLFAESAEAKILKQIERLEMAVQALEYEEETGKDLNEFFENAQMHITDEYLKQILAQVIQLRTK